MAATHRLLLGLLTLLFTPCAGRAADAPELLITNAHIHTQDAAHRVVAALAVRGNVIVATGSDAEIAK